MKLSRRAALILTAAAVVAGISTSHPDARQSGPEFYTGKNVDIVGPYGTAPYSPTGSNPFMLGDPDRSSRTNRRATSTPTIRWWCSAA